LAFNVIHKNQYYFYYNLGITRNKLLRKAFLFNVLFTFIVGFVFYFIFI
jgi:hypothetical protein